MTICCAIRIVDFQRELRNPPQRVDILQDGIDGIVFEYLWPPGYAILLQARTCDELKQLESMQKKMDDLHFLVQNPEVAQQLYAY